MFEKYLIGRPNPARADQWKIYSDGTVYCNGVLKTRGEEQQNYIIHNFKNYDLELYKTYNFGWGAKQKPNLEPNDMGAIIFIGWQD